METNDLYDNIVETSTISGGSIRKQCSIKIQPATTVDLSSLVPLYNKETPKEEVKSKRCKSKVSWPILPSKMVISPEATPAKKVAVPKSSNNLLKTNSKCSMLSTGSINSILETRHKKSYLDLFHAKIGYVQGKNGEPGDETARAVIGDSTFRSLSDNSSEFSDAKSYVSDCSSFYLKFVQDEMRKVELTEPECISKCSLTSSDSLGLLKSVSEFSDSRDVKQDKDKKKSCARKIRKFNNKLMDVPVLGRLGPDAEANKEKLLKLKRQQSYGQKVSNENRIKMLEMEVVKNFKQELKKSSQLNKSTKSVLDV